MQGIRYVYINYNYNLFKDARFPSGFSGPSYYWNVMYVK